MVWRNNLNIRSSNKHKDPPHTIGCNKVLKLSKHFSIKNKIISVYMEYA